MIRMAKGSRALRALVLTLGLGLAAASVLASSKLKEGDVDVIADWIGGVYDTAPVAGARAGDGHVLIIERVSSPMISWHVFYAEESDADGTVIAQQLLSFELAGDKKSIVERSFSFKEPRRWQDALQHPDVFKSIIADDITVASGCEIFWFRDKQGFAGRTTPHACRLRSRATGVSMEVDIVTHLTAAEFLYGERMFNKRAAGMR